MAGFSCFLGLYFNRLSRGLSVDFFYSWMDVWMNPRNHDEYDKDNVDIVAFWSAFGFVGFAAFMVVKAW